MQITSREFSGEADIQAMMALARESPTDNLHVVDLPYRFSSWALDYPDNIRLWHDAHRRLLAWAVMQTPFWTVDYAYQPDAAHNLHPQILAWANQRAREIVDTPSGHPAWYVAVFSSQADRIGDLEAAGFASQANVGDDSWSQVFLQHSGSIPGEGAHLPTGFTIRPLAGESEVAAYVEVHRAAFESVNMTAEWRYRTLHRPEYAPDLDLVAAAPDGRLVAFCVCWLGQDSTGKIQGQIEPLGVHPDFRRLGLGRAILSEGLRRLRLKGAERIYVETDNYRNAAFRLYESASFRVLQDILVYRKDCEGSRLVG